ncbi:MAG TPA: bifunctional helix-turn-helix transcriptional regulator/GNAT family N-acetyltransferase [Geminicoccus sp.]|uniref:bifunctional helix-turn-helix transcriptional regulator/GNAT family N-acetyltransferase n=1 Tax=Geminicoccus sp. TaxID=2024832 RepID=UPI002C122F82|nr:bifunctional helix-turn-helix transcriptional regulator/GNAT family N-acetyltransferase [Geminicoccus sp.]HWL71491.1 bifunctional helix-turn-helix transcriptional regulator/GNAT family N-acetyltransferase [Geminicoccus sp.]
MELQQAVDQDQVAAVRGFNRFYTRQIGLLDEGLHQSKFSLTECRVLYELAQHDGQSAAGLGRELGLDAGYLSRILKRFEAQGLISRTPAPGDARQAVLRLTPQGRAAYRPLDRASQQEVAAMLARLPRSERRRLVEAMTTVHRVLAGIRAEVVLREHRPGDIGWIIHRQARLYAEEYGWDATYEALAAEIAGAFVRSLDPDRERCWIAEQAGEIVGSVFLMRQTDAVAQLRLLYVEPRARGSGLGRHLVATCIACARAMGYRVLTLWTNDCLVAARRIYEEAGFRLVREEPHHSFGKDLVGQTWELAL